MNPFTLFETAAWVPERELVALGINRDALRGLRRRLLKKNADFRIEKNSVEISRAGFDKLAGHLKVAPEALEGVRATGQGEASPETPLEKNAAPADQQVRPTKGLLTWPAMHDTVTLCVWRVFPKNRHIIEAYRPGTDPGKRENVLRVKVRDSARFARLNHLGQPMELDCKHLQADFYEHSGPLPRRKGRA